MPIWQLCCLCLPLEYIPSISIKRFSAHYISYFRLKHFSFILCRQLVQIMNSKSSINNSNQEILPHILRCSSLFVWVRCLFTISTHSFEKTRKLHLVISKTTLSFCHTFNMHTCGNQSR